MKDILTILGKDEFDGDVLMSLDYAVSIRDEEKYVSKSIKPKYRHFTHFYYDLEEPLAGWPECNIPQKENMVQLIDDLRIIHDHSKSTPDPLRIAISCHAGISRSTAAALTYLYMEYGCEDKAFQALLKRRSFAWPNLLMLKYIDEDLQSNLYGYVNQWKEREKNTAFSRVEAAMTDQANKTTLSNIKYVKP